MRRGRSQVKVEVSPVLRGTLHPSQECDVVEAEDDVYRQEFVGMARADIPLQQLEDVRHELLTRRPLAV